MLGDGRLQDVQLELWHLIGLGDVAQNGPVIRTYIPLFRLFQAIMRNILKLNFIQKKNGMALKNLPLSMGIYEAIVAKHASVGVALEVSGDGAMHGL